MIKGEIGKENSALNLLFLCVRERWGGEHTERVNGQMKERVSESEKEISL